ncbi:MAG: hypothetical protein Q8O56_14735 [Solirubrobacteraceae bacterium]|nr:hypothetical protein [Solirubrobacteraceae bacterium]
MTARGIASLVLLGALAVGVALAPATGAQDGTADPGDGTAISGEVPSVLELSLHRGGPNLLAARVTATINGVQLLAGAPGATPGTALQVGVGGRPPRPLTPAALALSRWDGAVTGARVLLRTRATPAGTTTGALLEITAAPQTP